MAERNEAAGKRAAVPWRLIGWGAVALVLVVQWLRGAPWTPFDYVAAAFILGGAGLALELLVRMSGDLAYRAGAACAVGAAAMLVFVNAAVGFLGGEDNPANMMFFGVVAIAALGSALMRFRAQGMAWTMFAAAAAQVLVALVALSAGWTSPGPKGLYEAGLGTFMFTALWLLAGGLFRASAARQRSAAEAP